MNSTRKLMCSMAVASALLGTVWIAVAQRTADTPSKAANSQKHSWDRVDDAARNLRAGDETTVRTLVAAVFADNGIDDRIVATSGSVPDRLVKAEMAFQSGKASGITDDKIVTAVNQLAQRFQAPPYAYTDVNEIRRLRLKMLAVYPHLIGRGSASKRDDSKPHFDATMGPIEAFHITATLLFQKISNPEFQFSAQELRSAQNASNADATSALADRVGRGDRTKEIQQVIRKGASSMSFRDMLSQSEQTLDNLGIAR